MRCGWGLERNRNGGSAAAAVLALPAVGGKFGVRGGGFSMSNSSAWGIKAAAWMDDTPEPHTRLVNMNHLGRALLDYDRSAGQDAVRLQLQSAGDDARPEPRAARTAARGPVHRRLRAGRYRHRRYADVLLPATTFLENYDIARGYGPISLQLVQPVIEPVGEARPNAEVFSELAAGSGVGEAEEETDTLLRVVEPAAAAVSAELMERASATPPYDGAPIQFVDVFPLTPDREGPSLPGRLDQQRPAGLYVFQPDPGTERYPLALISPASEKTISSTLGELRERAARAADAPGRRRGSRPRARRSGPRLQRPRRSAVPVALNTEISRARCRCPRACGARAPTTARPRTRSCPTRSPTSAAAPASTMRASRSRLLGKH